MSSALEQSSFDLRTRLGSADQYGLTSTICPVLPVQPALQAGGLQEARYAFGRSMRDSSAFDIYWAGGEDESDIRALIGSVAMPGAVSVRFAREPDYFLGASIMGNR